jgi:hypothetical protein
MGTGGGAELDAWVDRYRGLPLDLVLRLARLEGRPVRVTGPADAAAAGPPVPDRLTVQVDADGSLVEVRAG